MCDVEFPVIDPIATGKTILSLRKENVLTVRNLLEFFGFEEPQAITDGNTARQSLLWTIFML